MWLLVGSVIVSLAIGFGLGRLRPKICARTVRRMFRIKPAKRPYAITTAAAVTYLIEIEKQEIEARHEAMKQMTTATMAALAISGALILKQMTAFHWLAIMFYVIAFVSILIGHLTIGDYRKKRFNTVLESLRREKEGHVVIPATNICTPVFAKVAISVTYLAFLAGVVLTIYSFAAKGYCSVQANRMTFVCELATISETFSAEYERPFDRH